MDFSEMLFHFMNSINQARREELLELTRLVEEAKGGEEDATEGD